MKSTHEKDRGRQNGRKHNARALHRRILAFVLACALLMVLPGTGILAGEESDYQQVESGCAPAEADPAEDAAGGDAGEAAERNADGKDYETDAAVSPDSGDSVSGSGPVQEENAEEDTDITELSCSGSGYAVTVQNPNGFAGAASFSADEITAEHSDPAFRVLKAGVDKALEEENAKTGQNNEIEGIRFFDLKGMSENGESVNAPVSGTDVTFALDYGFMTVSENAQVRAVRFDEQSNAEFVNGTTSDVNGTDLRKVQFTADTFAVYGVVVTSEKAEEEPTTEATSANEDQKANKSPVDGIAVVGENGTENSSQDTSYTEDALGTDEDTKDGDTSYTENASGTGENKDGDENITPVTPDATVDNADQKDQQAGEDADNTEDTSEADKKTNESVLQKIQKGLKKITGIGGPSLKNISGNTVAADGTYTSLFTVAKYEDGKYKKNYSGYLYVVVEEGKIAGLYYYGDKSSKIQPVLSSSGYIGKAASVSAIENATVDATSSASLSTSGSTSASRSGKSYVMDLKSAIISAIQSADPANGTLSESTTTTVVNDGTYKGSSSNSSSSEKNKITLNVTVADGKITDISIVSDETTGSWDSLVSTVKSEVVGTAANSSNVDAVSSATSKGWKAAIQNAIKNALDGQETHTEESRSETRTTSTYTLDNDETDSSNTATKYIEKGDTVTLRHIISYNGGGGNASTSLGSGSSSNSSVVSVTGSGANIVATGVAPGTATISAYSSYSQKTVIWTIIVLEPVNRNVTYSSTQTVENKAFYGDVTVASGANVTFKNCRFYSGIDTSAGGLAIIEDCEFVDATSGYGLSLATNVLGTTNTKTTLTTPDQKVIALPATTSDLAGTEGTSASLVEDDLSVSGQSWAGYEDYSSNGYKGWYITGTTPSTPGYQQFDTTLSYSGTKGTLNATVPMLLNVTAANDESSTSSSGGDEPMSLYKSATSTGTNEWSLTLTAVGNGTKTTTSGGGSGSGSSGSSSTDSGKTISTSGTYSLNVGESLTINPGNNMIGSSDWSNSDSSVASLSIAGGGASATVTASKAGSTTISISSFFAGSYSFTINVSDGSGSGIDTTTKTTDCALDENSVLVDRIGSNFTLASDATARAYVQTWNGTNWVTDTTSSNKLTTSLDSDNGIVTVTGFSYKDHPYYGSKTTVDDAAQRVMVVVTGVQGKQTEEEQTNQSTNGTSGVYSSSTITGTPDYSFTSPKVTIPKTEASDNKKSISAKKTDDSYDITLSMKGVSGTTTRKIDSSTTTTKTTTGYKPVDVVLLVDYSYSIKGNGATDNVTNSAKQFISDLAGYNADSNVALVTYGQAGFNSGHQATSHNVYSSSWTTAGNASALASALDTARNSAGGSTYADDYDYGTNHGGAYEAAQTLLNSRNDSNDKYVINISDGVFDYSSSPFYSTTASAAMKNAGVTIYYLYWASSSSDMSKMTSLASSSSNVLNGGTGATNIGAQIAEIEKTIKEETKEETTVTEETITTQMNGLMLQDKLSEYVDFAQTSNNYGVKVYAGNNEVDSSNYTVVVNDRVIQIMFKSSYEFNDSTTYKATFPVKANAAAQAYANEQSSDSTNVPTNDSSENGNVFYQYTLNDTDNKVSYTDDPVIPITKIKSDPVKTYTITGSVTYGNMTLTDGTSANISSTSSTATSKTITANEKENVTVSYSPMNSGYELDYVEVDGEKIDTSTYKSSYPFTGVDDNHTINVVYKVKDNATTAATQTLTVKELTSGTGADTNKNFNYSITYTNASGTETTESFTLSNDNTKEFTVKTGTTATIKQTKDSDYQLAISSEDYGGATNDDGDTYTISAVDASGTVTFTNTKYTAVNSTTSLTVNKVWGSGATEADNVTVALTPTSESGSTVTYTMNKATDNWTHTFTGLSSGTTYNVTETAVNGEASGVNNYSVSYSDVSSSNPVAKSAETDITENKTYVFVFQSGSYYYALTGSSGNSLTTTRVTVSNGEITSTVPDTAKWKLTNHTTGTQNTYSGTRTLNYYVVQNVGNSRYLYNYGSSSPHIGTNTSSSNICIDTDGSIWVGNYMLYYSSNSMGTSEDDYTEFTPYEVSNPTVTITNSKKATDSLNPAQEAEGMNLSKEADKQGQDVTPSDTVELTLEAGSSGRTVAVPSTDTNPVDILLVLDQTNSMSTEDMTDGGSRQQALQKAASDFIDALSIPSADKGATKIALMTFIEYGDDNLSYAPIKLNTSWTSLSDSTKTSLKNTINGLSVQASTYGSSTSYIYPLQQAASKLDTETTNSTKYVVFFSDGDANADRLDDQTYYGTTYTGIRSAATALQGKATVYAIATGGFTDMTKINAVASSGKATMATSASDLASLFTGTATTINQGVSNTTLDSTAVFKDVVNTDKFDVSGATATVTVWDYNSGTWSALTTGSVSTTPGNTGTLSSWTQKATGSGQDGTLTINFASDGTVNVIGFSYKDHYLPSSGTEASGVDAQKLVLTISGLKLKSDAQTSTRQTQVHTNDDDNSGIYESDDTLVSNFDQPWVNIPAKSTPVEPSNTDDFGSKLTYGDSWQMVSNRYNGNSSSDKTKDTDGNVATQKNVVPIWDENGNLVENQFLVYLGVDRIIDASAYFGKAEVLVPRSNDHTTAGVVYASRPTNANTASGNHSAEIKIIDSSISGSPTIATFNISFGGNTVSPYIKLPNGSYLSLGSGIKNGSTGDDNTVDIGSVSDTDLNGVTSVQNMISFYEGLFKLNTLLRVEDQLGSQFTWQGVYNDYIDGTISSENNVITADSPSSSKGGTFTWTIGDSSNDNTKTGKAYSKLTSNDDKLSYLRGLIAKMNSEKKITLTNDAELVYKVKFDPTTSSLEPSSKLPSIADTTADNGSNENLSIQGQTDVNDHAYLYYKYTTDSSETRATFNVPEVRGMLYDINLTKTGENSTPLAGATFQIAKTDGWETATFNAKSDEEKQSISDSNGIVDFNDLTYGTYTVTEIKAPDGYKLRNDAKTSWKFTIPENAPTDGSFTLRYDPSHGSGNDLVTTESGGWTNTGTEVENEKTSVPLTGLAAASDGQKILMILIALAAFVGAGMYMKKKERGI